MPEYLAPGVFVEETSFRGKPIEGVSTSTAGFVGRAKKGPEGRPTLVTSFTQFVREFGTPYESPVELGDYLGHAVRGFFENGGRRAYIVRVLSDDAIASSALGLHGPVLGLASTVRGEASSLLLDSTRGVAVTRLLHIFRNGFSPGDPPDATVTVTGYDAVRRRVDIAPSIAPGTTLNAATTVIVVDGAPPESVAANRQPTFEALHRGAGGDGLAVRIDPYDRPPVRLVAREYPRVRPEIASGTGPSGAATLDLPPSAMPWIREGDRLRFDAPGGLTDTADIDAIPAVDVVFTATGSGIDYADTVGFRRLVRGGSTPIDLPAAQVNLSGVGLDMTGASNNTLSIDHSLAAFLAPGDVLELDDDGGNLASLTIVNVDYPAPTTIQLTSTPTDDFSAGTVTLVDSPGRLITGDTTGLAVPTRPDQPVALRNGPDADGTTIWLVEPARGAVWVDETALGGTVGFDNWRTFEGLEVGGPGTNVRLPLATTSGFYTGAVVEIDSGTERVYTTVAAVNPGDRTIEVVDISGLSGPLELDANPSDRAVFARVLEINVSVLEDDQVVESYLGLSWNPTSGLDSARRYYASRINDEDNGSRVIRVIEPALPSADLGDQPSTALALSLENGDDGPAPEDIHLIGADNGPGQRTGIESLKERTDISIVAVPGVTSELVQGALITHAELMKYRVAVLDAPVGSTDVTELLAHRNAYDSKHAAYYAPWLRTVDLSTGNSLLVPPSGHVIGIYARSDNERGVHKAPANEVVRGILEVELPFTTGEQEVLNPEGVNLIREFEGRGTRVWGARTLSSDQEWKYLNVRRLFNFMEASIDQGTQWVVFEPNNEQLWDRVRSTITSFLNGVWKTGALMGTTAENAFFVKADRTTMTQDDIDNGRLIVLIGVAPTFPAEFVIFRIGQFTANAT